MEDESLGHRVMLGLFLMAAMLIAGGLSLMALDDRHGGPATMKAAPATVSSGP